MPFACVKLAIPLFELFNHLQNIEKNLGKSPKTKEAPRIIDLDILFFGQEFAFNAEGLQIPHIRWKERLFVLQPLSDLVSQLRSPRPNQKILFDVFTLLKSFTNPHKEILIPL